MRVFLSWSGPESRAVAIFLRGWLKGVIQALDPWMSEEDIGKGTVSFLEILKSLDGAGAGVVIFTRGNLGAPWLYFEAGALAQKVGGSEPSSVLKLVCTYLYGVKPEDLLRLPLGNYQGTRAESREDTLRLVSSLNTLVSHPLDKQELEDSFGRRWDDLDRELRRIKEAKLEDAPAPKQADPADLLQSVLAALARLPSEVALQVTSELRQSATARAYLRGVLGEADEPDSLASAMRRMRMRPPPEIQPQIITDPELLAALGPPPPELSMNARAAARARTKVEEAAKSTRETPPAKQKEEKE